MTSVPAQTTFFMVGDDDRLVYLLHRYTEQSGCTMISMQSIPSIGEINRLQPAAIIFSSVEQLQVAQPLAGSLSTHEIPILVCASPADEALARELGADACLLHPLTYDNFRAVVSSVCPSILN